MPLTSLKKALPSPRMSRGVSLVTPIAQSLGTGVSISIWAFQLWHSGIGDISSMRITFWIPFNLRL